MQADKKKGQEKKENKKQTVYERPSIIETGQITTRAGSPTSIQGSPDGSTVDPTDLFGNDD